MAAKPLTITHHDGKTDTVQPTLEDRLNFESTLRKNKGWGDLKDNALKLEPFLAWSAAKRTGKTDLTWEEFTKGDKAAIDVEVAKSDDDADEDEALEVDGLGKGSKRGRSTTSRSSSA